MADGNRPAPSGPSRFIGAVGAPIAVLLALQGLYGSGPRTAPVAMPTATPATIHAAPTEPSQWCAQRLESFVSGDPRGSDWLRSSPQSPTIGGLSGSATMPLPDGGEVQLRVHGTYVSDVTDPSRSAVSDDAGLADARVAGALTDGAAPSGALGAGGADAARQPPFTFIALVPDPTDSGKGHVFDEEVAAIQSAMGLAEWVRDRQWLPWDDRWLLRAEERPLAATCRRDVPGVLVFRDNPEYRDRTALVYLVGETLTGGAPSGPLQYALARVAESTRDIRIVGPAFSNGAASLRREIDTFTRQHTGINIQIISGSANGPGLTEALTGHASDPDAGAAACKDKDGRIQFCTTHIGVDQLECAFWRFLADRQGVPVKRDVGGSNVLKGVALLSEQGTAYGGAIDNGAKNGHDCSPRSGLPGNLQPEVQLQFPIHVAAVRDAYAATEGRAGSGGELVRRTHLDISLGEEPGTDEPIELSSVTVASRDIALSHLLTEASTEGVRYLGVIATSVADELFLARKIRDVAPDVRLVFFENDALLTHPASRPYTMGSFVVTPYPFLGSGDLSVDPAGPHKHLPLESDVGEGVLNATLIAANHRGDLLEHWWLREDGHRTGPLVWIGAVGVSEVTPVYVDVPERRGCWVPDPADGDSGMTCGLSTPNDDVRSVRFQVDDEVTPPNVWQIALALLAAFAFRDSYEQWIRRGAVDGDLPDGQGPMDRNAELGVLRLRYGLAGALRSGVLLMALGHMLGVDVLALLRMYAWPSTVAQWLRMAVAGVAALSIAITARSAFCALRAFGRRYRELARLEESWASTKPTSRERGCRWLKAVRFGLRLVGLAPPTDLGDRIGQARRFEVVRLLTMGAIACGILMAEAWVAYNLGSARGHPNPNRALLILRTLPIVGGLSASWPFLFSLASVYFWARTRMTVLWLRHTMVLGALSEGDTGLVLPLAAILERDGRVADGLRELEVRAVDSASAVSSEWHLGQVMATVFLLLFPFGLQPPSTLEDATGTLVLSVELAVASFLVIASLLRLANYWVALRRLLDAVARRPAGRWIDLADAAVAGGPFSLASLATTPYLRSRGWTESVLVQRFEAVAAEDPTEGEIRDKLVLALGRAHAKRCSTERASRYTEGESVVRVASAAAQRFAAKLVRSDETGTKATFVATLLASLVRRYVLLLGAMMFGLLAQSFALLLAVGGYAVEPKRLLFTCVWILMLGIASVGFWILIDGNRNVTLSRLSHTTPGRVDWSWDFAEHVFRWVAIPLLVMVAAEYPGAAGSLWEKIAPVFHVLK